ncbi:MAG TPA: hypothetical protein VFQ43_16725, partial [Nitrososphaera sp.]|nr:hypothetical protein [Nitrososphaera sp.]
QFFPIQGTLVYCDNHFGTFLFYALFRFSGLSRVGAFQAWIIFALSADTASLLFLLRRLGVHSLVACPTAFFGTSSSMLLFKMGHPQVLPFFPFVLALSFFISFLQTADVKQLCWAIAFTAYQFLCFLYDGYFSILIFGPLLIIAILIMLNRRFWCDFSVSLHQHWRLVGAVSALAVGLTVLNLYPYAKFSAVAGTRSMQELINLAPNLGAWFSSSSFSLFYHAQRHYKEAANIGENTLFDGWMIWFLITAAIVVTIRVRKRKDLRLASVLVLTSLLEIALITTWHGQRGNAYLWLAARIEMIRAFRGFTRIAYLLIIVETVAGALLLNYWFHCAHARIGKIAAVVVAFALPVDGIATGQASYPKRAARKRGYALAETWRRAGGKEILIFAPGYTNQPASFVNVDCWQTAMQLNRVTVNGYSGNSPPDYHIFLQIPVLQNANNLIKQLRLDPAKYSLVTDWAQESKKELGIMSYPFQIKGAVIPRTATVHLSMRPLEQISLPVTLDNLEHGDLHCDSMRVFLSYRIYDSHGRPVMKPESLRTPIKLLRRGQTNDIWMRLQAPATLGDYEIRLSMVQESVAWWADLGFSGTTITLHVE